MKVSKGEYFISIFHMQVKISIYLWWWKKHEFYSQSYCLSFEREAGLRNKTCWVESYLFPTQRFHMELVNIYCFEEPSACLFLNHRQNSTCLEMVVYISEFMEERENPMEWEQMSRPHFLFLLKKKLLEWQVTSPCLRAPCSFAEGTSASAKVVSLPLPLFLWLGLIVGV